MAEAAAQAEAAFESAQGNSGTPITVPQIPLTSVVVPSLSSLSQPTPAAIEEVANESHSEAASQELPENLEHLQLTLSEAFFLAWGLGCLVITESDTVNLSNHFDSASINRLQGQILSLPNVWSSFLTPLGFSEPIYRWDNPFLVHYVFYHHFRSLGWIVKGGIKFCVDYLLYKRGPVFSHAEYVQQLPLSLNAHNYFI